MSNSGLVVYTKLSPHCNKPRRDKIRKITIHHAAGDMSLEGFGIEFSGVREVSANYAIDSQGRIGMYVEEKNRAWTSSSPENDNQAITIEVANDGGEPNWHVSNAALKAVINLCVDICKRNGIERLNFTGNKNGNLTMHKYFAATLCPGPYLESRFPYIADQVNKKLGVTAKPVTKNLLYHVQIGVFGSKKSADDYIAKAQKKGFSGYVVRDDNNLYHVQIGAFSSRKNADSYLSEAKSKGFNGFVVTENSATSSDTIKVGDKVYINRGAKTYDGGNLSSFVYDRVNVVKELRGDRAVVTYGGVVVAAVNIKDLKSA